ncbi:hypothetical protein IX306_001023 [Porphyromonas levii]|nr:hypothetical protein [Porphyromonas levii]
MYSAAPFLSKERRPRATKAIVDSSTNKRKKGETKISPRLDNFVGHEIQSPNPRAKAHNLPMLDKGLKQKEIAELIGVSPSTISRELKRNATKRGKYNHNYAQISLSHETIYKWIRKDKRDGGDLYKNCRHKLKKRKRGIYASSSTIPEKVSIHERPMEVDGNRFGDFEMDTIVSAGSKAILLTIVEISTSMIFMEKMDTGKKPKEIAKASIISFKKNI